MAHQQTVASGVGVRSAADRESYAPSLGQHTADFKTPGPITSANTPGTATSAARDWDGSVAEKCVRTAPVMTLADSGSSFPAVCTCTVHTAGAVRISSEQGLDVENDKNVPFHRLKRQENCAECKTAHL